MAATYAVTVPSTAPRKARAPAVMAVRVRRVMPLAPVAVRVRRSLAVSLRMRPTLMARMASARAIPKTVAQLMISAEEGALDLVSMVRPAAAAGSLALLIWAAVGGWGVWMGHPSVLTCRPNSWTACSVKTVLGADVPEGRALTSWITGLARQVLFGQGYVCWLLPPGPLPPPPPPGPT